MEINLSIDETGRTSFLQNPNPTTNNKDQYLNYSSQTFQTCLPPTSIPGLITNAHTLDAPELPRTYFIKPNDIPSCEMETMAQQIFAFHTRNVPTGVIDFDLSWSEWWFQVRPNVKGSYLYKGNNDDDIDADGKRAKEGVVVKDLQAKDQSSSLSYSPETNNTKPTTKTTITKTAATPQTLAKSGISWHWDKDENLRDQTNLFIHPHISTVTYLTSYGAPTVVLNGYAELEGGAGSAKDITEGIIVFPETGKHLSFDGSKLHAGVKEFLVPGVWEGQVDGGGFRVTFLVNIWVNFIPIGVRTVGGLDGKCGGVWGGTCLDGSDSCKIGVSEDDNISKSPPSSSEKPKTPKLNLFQLSKTKPTIPLQTHRVKVDDKTQPTSYIIGSSQTEAELLHIPFPINKIRELSGSSIATVRDISLEWDVSNCGKIKRVGVSEGSCKDLGEVQPPPPLPLCDGGSGSGEVNDMRDVSSGWENGEKRRRV